jgi:hypothetical protein
MSLSTAAYKAPLSSTSIQELSFSFLTSPSELFTKNSDETFPDFSASTVSKADF